MHRPNAKFRVRDEVIITDVKKCAWGSNKHMEAMIGSVVTISSRIGATENSDIIISCVKILVDGHGMIHASR